MWLLVELGEVHCLHCNWKPTGLEFRLGLGLYRLDRIDSSGFIISFIFAKWKPHPEPSVQCKGASCPWDAVFCVCWRERWGQRLRSILCPNPAVEIKTSIQLDSCCFDLPPLLEACVCSCFKPRWRWNLTVLLMKCFPDGILYTSQYEPKGEKTTSIKCCVRLMQNNVPI